MAADNIETGSVNPEARKRLMESISTHIARDSRVYAVLEGALFNDLPTQLSVAGIAHRSLYRGGDRNLIVGGPWLVNLGHHHPTDDDLYEVLGDDSIKLKDEIVARPAEPVVQIEALWQIVTDSRAAVFWIGDSSLTEDALYTHLRTINEILILAEGGGPAERVTFRHSDANVMAQVLPALDEVQFARLLGPARSILFTPHDDWGGGLKRADRPEGILATAAGPLVFSIEGIKNIEAVRFDWLSARTSKYLREYGKQHVAEKTDAEIQADVNVWLRSSLNYGVSLESAHRKWCYMQLVTQGLLEGYPGVREYMYSSYPEPDANIRVSDLMNGLINKLREL
ncbi:DUF4123 domain-containing protein [Phyllobacterium sp. SB3]|uniref:DUF4123 domain-containing protein n=1 Tax=Phyllobacterium sp. SB3 TaxID=3156073 RepID=UPI0032B00E74